MNKQIYNILLVEDDRIDQMAFKKTVDVKKLEYKYHIVGSVAEAKEASAIRNYDVVITDYLLGDGNAFDILEFFVDTPIIITTGAGNEEVAAKAMQRGIRDYLIKDMSNNYLKMLPITIENAINRHQNKKQLRLLSHAIMNIGDSVYITDCENKIIFINKAFTEIYGYKADEIIGKYDNLLRLASDFSVEKLNADLDEPTYNNETIHIRKDGRTFPALISHSLVKDDNGSFTANVWAVRDITEIKEAQSKLEVYATTDTLTGVLNRRAGLLVLEKQFQICKRNNLKLTTCYIDINNLKHVNDKYGHQEGDEFILVITEALKETIRESDILCRLGGDEFLLVFSECGIEDASVIWNSIIHKLNQYNDSGVKPYFVSISGGFAEYNASSSKTLDELIALADEEMYKNKKKYKEQRGLLT